jgi:molybdopterin converting factor small subunit
MANLIIPTPLRKFTAGAATFRSEAPTVDALLQALAEAHPGLKPHLFDGEGTLRHFIRVYVGDEDIEALDGVSTALETHTEVSIIPAIAGGTSDPS